MARALWIAAAGVAELRAESPTAGPEEVLVETRFSGISRGTEALVFHDGVPAAERQRMRCPLQAGEFPFPVKYGYAAVGQVVRGTRDLVGHEVFVLHPHQDRFAAPAAMAVPLPAGIPAARAVLAANMETALNIVWDAGVAPGDHIAVVGAGVVGALAAWLCARLPGAEVTLIDVNPERAPLAEALGCRFAAPEAAPKGCDLAIHASGTGAGLATALAALGREGTVVEASWYGTRSVGLGARRRLPQPAAPHRREPGGRGAAAPARPLDPAAAAGGGAGAAGGPRARRADQRRDRLCRPAGPLRHHP